jgi:hypothetical protein
MIRKIVSGGQTGADRAALDVAIRLGVEHGGWAPKGRKAEDGKLPQRYRLDETPTAKYAERTERNAADSDATLIVSNGPLTGGSRLTLVLAVRHSKPCLHLDMEKRTPSEAGLEVIAWIEAHGVETLNVAGPRASKDPRIYGLVSEILETVLKEGSPVQGDLPSDDSP